MIIYIVLYLLLRHGIQIMISFSEEIKDVIQVRY